MFAQLQARELLLAQQVHIIDNLIRKITDLFCIEALAPHTSSSSEGQDNNSAIKYITFASSLRVDVMSITNHIRDQGSPAQTFYDRMDDGSKEAVVKQIAKYAMALVKGLKSVKAERDENNLPRDEEPPPVLPHELVKMRPAIFTDNVLNQHRNRLQVTWTQDEVEDIENDHRQLIKFYHNNEAVRKALDKHEDALQ